MHAGLLGEGLLVVYVLLLALLAVAALAGYRRFRPLAQAPAGGGHRVSVIVAAKEEADTLRESLASLTQLDYPGTELIVVCGDSEDATESVAKEFEGRATVLREPERPPDWLGKSWACHNGYLRSSGDVLLFTDGDVIHSKESLRLVLANLDDSRADLLSVWPQIVTRTFSERVIFPASLFFLCAGVTAVGTTRTPRGRRVNGANGQYIMVRRAAYEAIGGHAAIRSYIMEDGALGRLSIQRGLEVANMNGEGQLRVKPYSRFGEAWEAHERFGAGLIPSWEVLVAACGLTVAFFVGPFLVLGAGLAGMDAPLLAAGGVTCALVFAVQGFFSIKGSRPWYFLLAPISGLLVAAAFSVGFVKFRRGGITWKRAKYALGTFKPLSGSGRDSGRVP